VVERDYLNRRLDALGSRLTNDTSQGRPSTHLLEEVEQASARLLELQDAIAWTLQHIAVRQKPLGSYLNKSSQLQRMADLLENNSSPEFRERVDCLHEAKKATDVLVQTIYWAYDLQIPEITVSDEPEEED
jgi:hypothetical protein